MFTLATDVSILCITVLPMQYISNVFIFFLLLAEIKKALKFLYNIDFCLV